MKGVRVVVYKMRDRAPRAWPGPGNGAWARLLPMGQMAVAKLRQDDTLPPPIGAWVIDGGTDWTWRLTFQEAIELAQREARTDWGRAA